VTTTGGAKCWGGNYFGTLGNNSNTDSWTPVDVYGLTSGVVQLAGGGGHTCAVTASGAAKCWGWGSAGQLGNNSTGNSTVPVDVAGLGANVASIAAGYDHTCVVTTSGAAKCWGSGSSGQLGNNGTASVLVPTDVSGLTSGASRIAAGASHTCAVTTGGAAKCWGSGNYGQLGDGNGTMSLVPVSVSGLTSGVTSIAVGNSFSCVVVSGGAKCWGYGGQGRLGNNSNVDAIIPVDVTP
jgi:hypothetical protein